MRAAPLSMIASSPKRNSSPTVVSKYCNLWARRHVCVSTWRIMSRSRITRLTSFRCRKSKRDTMLHRLTATVLVWNHPSIRCQRRNLPETNSVAHCARMHGIIPTSRNRIIISSATLSSALRTRAKDSKDTIKEVSRSETGNKPSLIVWFRRFTILDLQSLHKSYPA